MKKRLVSIVVLALFALSVIAPSVLAADNTVLIYVAPGGSDSGVGSIESPLKTFEGAKSRVRELRAQFDKELAEAKRKAREEVRLAKQRAKDEIRLAKKKARKNLFTKEELLEIED